MVIPGSFNPQIFPPLWYADNEFALTVFGPGVGECILMHFGNGDWFVVDSCVCSSSKSPVAMEYLQTLGLNPADAVRGILATHWHDDHDLSVALQVSSGSVDILLKADLEDCVKPQHGWRAVLQSRFRPKRKAQLVKVGHHGSANADNDQVWVEMVEAAPWCVVTPYCKLKVPRKGSGNFD